MPQTPILTDSFEKARYDLSRNLTILTTVLLTTVGIIYLIEDDVNAYPLITTGLIALVSYLCIVKTKKFKIPVMCTLVVLSAVSGLNLTMTSNFHHTADLFWIICISISGFFILGKTWGVTITIVNLIVLFVVFLAVKEGFITQPPKPYTPFSQVKFLINLGIGGTLFTYLILKFLNQNKSIATENLTANKELTLLNEEKTVMLKEIHHRVKNNLQIVTSLLRLQSYEMEDQQMKNDFNQAISRVLAIAKIHEKMYNNQQLNRIDLANYLGELLQDLTQSYAGSKKVTTNVRSNITAIDPKHLVPIALIFNELVTNSLKHAFTHKDTGSISIEAFIDETKTVRIKYEDNGRWSENQTPTNKGSIGLELINSFVDQLDAKMTVTKKETDTTYTFEFELN